MSRLLLLLAALALMPGCFLAPTDSFPWGADDDDAADDDDDDDDTGDADGDGHIAAEDCDDGNPRVYPGAPEVWDFRINDCDADQALPEVLHARAPQDGQEPGAIVHNLEWEFFGVSWSLGDLDGDGREDLCARTESWDHGDVLVFLDIEAHTTPPGTVLNSLDADVRVQPEYQGFGNIDCGRDVDDDGDTDLVYVSALDEGGGGIYVYDGGSDFAPGALLGPQNASASMVVDEGYVGSCFGIGQLDGEGGLEIVVSSMVTTAGGSPEPGLAVTDSDLTIRGFVPVAGFDSWTPDCWVVGDLTGDGTDELVIADDGGTRLVLGERRDTSGPMDTWTGGYYWNGWWAGHAVSADITGSAAPELIMSNDGFDDDDGAVLVYYGSGGAGPWEFGLEDGDWPDPDRSFWIEPEGSGARFGTHVCPLGDVDGDGFGDFAVGSPGQDGSDGLGLVFVGRNEADWRALAGGDGVVSAGNEISRFVGSFDDGVGHMGRSWGHCNYTWASPMADPRAIWWKVSSVDEEGSLLHWVQQQP
jgi:hypothetical protein